MRERQEGAGEIGHPDQVGPLVRTNIFGLYPKGHEKLWNNLAVE